MISATAIIGLLILFLLLYLIYWCFGALAPGVPQKIIGIVLALIFLIRALQTFGIDIL